MPTCCCVPGCSTRGGLSFPREERIRKLWIRAIRRNDEDITYKHWTPQPFSVVCHKHFREEDFTSETQHGTEPLRRQRKPDAVPSIFPWTKSKWSYGVDERSKRVLARRAKLEKDERENSEMETEMVSDVCNVYEMGNSVEVEDEKSCFSDNDIEISAPVAPVFVDSSSQTAKSPIMCIENFMYDDEGIMFYTGLSSYTDFLHVLYSLGEAAFHLNYIYNQVQNMSIENQLFLTLIKLRQHKPNFELSRLFSISQTTVENIWITWVNFMSRQWRELNFWPDKDLVSFFSPSDFYSKFPSTRVLLDGTEIPVKKPKPPIAQQATFSTYKNRNTVKVLVGSTPGGLISYVSSAYGGSASDRQLVERSPLVSTDLFEPGDSLMADKGFNVQDLFAPKDVSVNIPSFFKKQNRMSGKTVLRDRKISSKRVHIERLIGLGKTYKILKTPLNTTETKLASEILFVCFTLCNFKKCIVPKHA
ncbi:uncharacterized protein LOC133176262 [Saccostrea echinata]|uniref:uncharacterized protein LOC133176262 n=1 Tax=Saccostrea echinata TaxID=191078 RepID=UPI002A7F651C|nr:uncharacterized protein LOC133176262 [Saccostrea echinata]